MASQLDLPDDLQRMMNTGTQNPATPQQPVAPNFDINYPPPNMTYQEGGMVGPGGVPVRSGIQEQTPPPENLSPDAMQMQINNVVQKNPQGIEQVKAVMMEGLQTGEITQQELNMLVQLATVAMQNPEMYPQIRQYAIQQGLGTAEDIPEQYDQGLVLGILIAAQSIQGGPQQPRMSMQFGGALPEDSANPDGTIAINAHEGEFVIPKNVVQEKGTDFFNNLIKPKG
jgi:hypothetical protein